MKFQFIAGKDAPYSNKEAKMIAATFLNIIQEDGQLTKDGIVGRARVSDSPLHRYFEWDDKKAAHEHRRAQAAFLVKTLDVIDTEGLTTRVVPFVEYVMQKKTITPTPAKEPHHFVTVSRTKLHTPDRQTLLRNALKEARNWRDKYAGLGLSELQAIYDAVDDFSK
jgi:hypothetical protein